MRFAAACHFFRTTAIRYVVSPTGTVTLGCFVGDSGSIALLQFSDTEEPVRGHLREELGHIATYPNSVRACMCRRAHTLVLLIGWHCDSWVPIAITHPPLLGKTTAFYIRQVNYEDDPPVIARFCSVCVAS